MDNMQHAIQIDLVDAVTFRGGLCFYQFRPSLWVDTDSQVVHVAYVDESLLRAHERMRLPLLRPC